MKCNDRVEGLVTLVKFFQNPYQKNADRHPVITRTLKKIGFVSDSASNSPSPGEFWLVEIERMIKNAFFLRPIQKVDSQNITRLIPGFYSVRIVKHSVLVIPRMNDGYWILPKTLKNAFGYVDSVIVVHSVPKPCKDCSANNLPADTSLHNPYKKNC